MDTIVVFGLLALQFGGLALFAIALVLFVGLMVWDLVADTGHREPARVEEIEPRRSAADRAPRLTA
jgi:hypothetical protein